MGDNGFSYTSDKEKGSLFLNVEGVSIDLSDSLSKLSSSSSSKLLTSTLGASKICVFYSSTNY